MLLDFNESKSLLEKYSLPVANCRLFLANEVENALTFAQKISFPVVLKGYGQNLLHRTEENGVLTKIENKDEFVKGFESLNKFENILVQKKAQGLELFIGAKNDSQFGPIILFGLGGIFVEAIKDVSLGLCPLNENEAFNLIKKTKAYNILSGARGKSFNVDALKKVLVNISQMMNDNSNLIKEMDFNPLFINENEVLLADFKIIENKD